MDIPPNCEVAMTNQGPEPVEPTDEPLVEPEETTNDVSQQDDVEVAENQDPYPDIDEVPTDSGIQELGRVGDTVVYGNPAGIALTGDWPAEPVDPMPADVRPDETLKLDASRDGGEVQ